MRDKTSTKSKLTATEFAQLPETLIPRELIHGELIEMSAPKNRHQDIVLNIAVFLRDYTRQHGGKAVIAPMNVFLDEFNVVQPDVFWVHPESDRCMLGQDDWWHGAPDLVVEVFSTSTTRHDRVVKFRLYEQFGVREYWMIDPENGLIEIWGLQNHKFVGLGIYEKGDEFISVALNHKKILVDDLLG